MQSSHNPDLETLLTKLKEKNILSDRLSKLISQDAYAISEVLKQINKLEQYPFLFTEKFFLEVFKQNSSPWYIWDALELAENNLYSDELLDFYTNTCMNKSDFIKAVNLLKQHELYSDVNLKLLMTHSLNSNVYAEALVLTKDLVIDKNNFLTILQRHTDPKAINVILKKLAGRISLELLNQLYQHPSPLILQLIFGKVSFFVSEEQVQEILNCQHIEMLFAVIDCLTVKKLFSSDLLNYFLDPATQEKISLIIVFDNARILNKNNFNNILDDQPVDDDTQRALENYVLDYPEKCFRNKLSHKNSGSLFTVKLAQQCTQFESIFYLLASKNLLSEKFLQFSRLVELKKLQGIKYYNELLIKFLPDYHEYLLRFLVKNSDVIKNLTTKALIKLVNCAINNKQIAEKLGQSTFLQEINLHDEGHSKDTWWELTKNLIQLLPQPHKFKQDTFDIYPKMIQSGIIQKTPLHEYIKDCTFLRLQGRTILFETKEKDIIAVKVQKKNEPTKTFLKEYFSVKNFSAKREVLGLHVYLPQALAVVTTEINFAEFLKNYLPEQEITEFLEMTSQRASKHIYIYSVDHAHRDYFTYLHDITMPQPNFSRGSENILTCLFQLLKHGFVFPEMADFTHNSNLSRDDRGRYIVLANLLSMMAVNAGSTYGNGRVHQWLLATQYLNARGENAPFADVGDWIAIKELKRNGEFTKNYFNYGTVKYGPNIFNFLVCNQMAEYLYILFLATGRRTYYLTEKYKSENKSADDIQALWLQAAEQVMLNCATAIASLTYKSQSEAMQLFKSMFSVTDLARQMQFWMTKEYTDWVEREVIPENIYGKNVKVEIDTDQFRQGTYSETLGCCEDGVNADLGFVNGQEPIKIFNQMLYWTVNVIVLNYFELMLALKETIKISRAKEVVTAYEMLNQSFKYLSPKTFHALQLSLREWLAKTQLPENTQRELQASITQHKQEYSAHVIQSMWRKRRVVKETRQMHSESVLRVGPR